MIEQVAKSLTNQHKFYTNKKLAGWKNPQKTQMLQSCFFLEIAKPVPQHSSCTLIQKLIMEYFSVFHVQSLKWYGETETVQMILTELFKKNKKCVRERS